MIKNLKISEKIKKNSLKKILLIGTLSLGLTACTNEKQYHDNNKDYEYNHEFETKDNNHYEEKYTDETTTENNNDINIEQNEEEKHTEEITTEFNNNIENETTNNQYEEIIYDDVLSQTIINSSVNLNSNEVEDFKNKINEVQVDYLYGEYFEIDKAMDAYENNKLNLITSNLNIINNNKLEFDTLYKIIKANNEQYKKENSAILKYNNPSDSDLRNICTWMCESINYEIENGIVNIDALEEKINTLKVFEVADFSYGYYSIEDEILAFNKNMIDSQNRNTLFEEIICHEIKHLVQSSSKTEMENTSIIESFGVCYKYKDLNINSLYPNWLFEGVAEKQTLQQLGIEESLKYSEYIKSLDMLTITTITKNEAGDLEKICMQSDLEELYKFFGATTKEEKQEISTMLYAYNIIKVDGSFSSTYDFHENYKSKHGEKMDFTEKRYYGYNLSSSISQTLSKIFYNNLAVSIENKNISLKEIFSLITNYEIKLSEQCRYYDSVRMEDLNDFYTNYNIIQQDFFEIIATQLNLRTEEVMGAYQLFYKNYELSENISILSSNNQTFLNMNETTNEYYKKGSVYEQSIINIKGYSK